MPKHQKQDPVAETKALFDKYVELTGVTRIPEGWQEYHRFFVHNRKIKHCRVPTAIQGLSREKRPAFDAMLQQEVDYQERLLKQCNTEREAVGLAPIPA